MGKKIPFFLILLLSQIIYGQKEGNIWYFGNYGGLNFNSGVPVSLNDGQLTANEGAAVISDNSGQLLFYTDGSRIWNRNHILMPNGSGLMGNSSSTQAALIIPKPDSSDRYYVFTTDESGNSNGFRYSEVNMSLDDGNGDVTAIKNILLSTPTCEKITAVKKADNSGYWVITHGFPNNNFLAFSVTAAGVELTPVVSSVGLSFSEPIQTVGQLKVSPDGTKIVNCSFKQRLELFDFNSSTGIVSNPRVLNNKKINYGAEFSPLSNVLYITTGNDSYIFDLVQYDLTAIDIAASEINLKTNILYQFGALQLGPDGKIYVSITNSDYVAYIDQPEVIGSGCSFIKNGIFIGTGECTFGLPQFIQSYFYSSSVVQQVCLGSTVSFSLPAELNIASALWDFGDGNTSNQINTTHNYNLPGLYDINVTAISNIGEISKKWQVLVSEVPSVNRVSNQVVCRDASTLYYLKKNDPIILGTQNPDLFLVDYFLTHADAIVHSNKLNSIYNLPLGVTNLFAKIYNAKNIQCYEITSFTVTSVDQLGIGEVSTYTICENQPIDSTEVFDLTTKNFEVLNGLDSSQFTITYHNSQQDADNDINAVSNYYENSLPQEIIYVRLESNNNQKCFATTSFLIQVIEKPVIGIISPFLECGDSSGNGITVFDLSQKTAEILGTLSPTTFNVSYYASLFNAQNGSNPIIAPYVNIINNQTIYVAISSTGNFCKTIGSFKLIVIPNPIRYRCRDIRVCDDASNDGKEIFNFLDHTAMMLEQQSSDQFLVSYHASNTDAQNDLNPLPFEYENISNPQTIYIRTENILNTNCFEINSFEIQVDSLPLATQPSDIYVCSNEAGGFVGNIDLHVQDAAILNGQPDSEFTVTYYTSPWDADMGTNIINPNYQNMVSPQQIFARVSNLNNPQCFAITDFKVNVLSKPILEMNDVYSFCQNDTIMISAPSGFDSYQWSTGATTESILVNTAMNINLIVTKDYGIISCDNSLDISVIESSVAIIKEIKISDWTESQNSIQIITYGNGDYEYSIDGENYQDSPYFYGLEMGQYTVYVKDKNECGIITKDIFLLVYPKYFTPNGDNHNEKWQIKFANLEPNLEVSIFDKYGKLITTFDGKSDGWDGTCNNVAQPSADYWFIVKRKNGVAYKGHFSLLR